MAEVVHIRVTGRVQGVGFREFTRITAQRLGIAGWVQGNRILRCAGSGTNIVRPIPHGGVWS
jgi:hypothetical protein